MASSAHDIFHDTVHHVFMPPKLPQQAPKDDVQRLVDLELVDSVHKSIETYMKLDSVAHEQWNHMSGMLSHLSRTVEASPEASRLQQDLSSMKYGDVLALYIRAQNCAVLVRKQPSATLFEIFEVQAPNGEVMSVPGKLVRSFPGRAVEVPNSVAEDSGFYAEIANFLVHMDKDILKGSTATTTKAGSEVVEVRDSAHPHYISQLFVGILRGMGTEIEPRRVEKRIADEILWDNAYKPWHRSPIWLIVRVALQTSLSSNTDYKHFMVYFEAQLLRRALKYQSSFDSDLLFAMRVKMARRLYKIRDTVPEFVVKTAKDVTEETQKVLEERWSAVQKEQERSPECDLAACTFEESVKQSLPNSRAYLEDVFRGRSSTNAPSHFSPSHCARLANVEDFAAFSNGALNSAFSADSHIALFDFEDSVHNHLSTWTTNNLSTQTACGVIASCLEQYTSLARSHYTMDVADKSIMVLTIMELWVALDRLATSQCSLLLDYSPELEEKLLEPLLLRTSLHIEQAGMVQRHLRQRHATARQTGKGSVFSDQASESSLAVRYFRQTYSLQALRDRIRAEATRQRNAKLEEMRRRNEEHRELMNRVNSMEHQNWTDWRTNYTRHDRWCSKCSLQDQANTMRIEVHEWPLPTSQLDEELVVFELMCPDVVRIWRDETYKILCDIGSSNRPNRNDSLYTLAGYDGLNEWSSTLRGSGGAITIASPTKSFIRSHYSPLPSPHPRAPCASTTV